MTRWCAVLVALLLVPVAVEAQGDVWEVEVHVGRSFIDALGSRMASLPAPGTPFTTTTSLPSRHASSWFLGDGAEVLNGSLAAVGLSERIVALDRVLAAPLAGRQGGYSYGFRVARDLTPRFAAEFSLDITSGVVEIAAPVAAALEATSASFSSVFRALLDAGPFTSLDIDSTYSVEKVDATQLVAALAFRVNLLSRGKVIPYATLGGGIIANNGATPTARLEGHYSFISSGVSPIAETDRVSLTHVIANHVYFGMLGGGAKVYLIGRSGVRLDARVHLGRDINRTLVNARPQVTEDVPAPLADAIASFGVPSIQFSNDPRLGASTLSGADITAFEAFRGGRTRRQVAVSLGYFWRF